MWHDEVVALGEAADPDGEPGQALGKPEGCRYCRKCDFNAETNKWDLNCRQKSAQSDPPIDDWMSNVLDGVMTGPEGNTVARQTAACSASSPRTSASRSSSSGSRPSSSSSAESAESAESPASPNLFDPSPRDLLLFFFMLLLFLPRGECLYRCIIEAIRHGYIETEGFPRIAAIVAARHLGDSGEDDGGGNVDSSVSGRHVRQRESKIGNCNREDLRRPMWPRSMRCTCSAAAACAVVISC